MKKTFKKLSTYLLSTILLAAAVLGTAVFGLTISPKSAKADGILEETIISGAQTVFMVNPTAIAGTSEGYYIYDASDNCLKLITEDFASRQSYSLDNYIKGENVSVQDMCSDGENIYILATNGLWQFNPNDQNSEYIKNISLDTYPVTQRNKISCGLYNDSPVLIIYASVYNSTDSNTYPIYGTQSESIGSWNFNLITLQGNEGVSLSSTISSLSIVGNSNNAYLLIASGNAINAGVLTLTNSNLSGAQSVSSITLNAVTTTNLTTDIIGLEVNYASEKIDSDNSDEEDMPESNGLEQNLILTVLSEDMLSTYKLELNGTITATFLTKQQYYFGNENFSVTNVGLADGTPLLLSDNCFYAYIGSEFVKYANPDCSINMRSAQNFEYFKLNSNALLIESPSSTNTTTLLADTCVVEIADIFLSDESSLQGYRYVMACVADGDAYKNVYGYIVDGEDLSPLEKTTLSGDVKAADSTYLYALPSTITDQNNTHISFSGKLPVTLLATVADYYTGTSESPTMFYLVQVDGNVGFIDASRVISSDEYSLLILPNAKLLSDSKVYLEADSTASVLHTLSSGTKVRIVGSRDKNGYILVRYNDQYGNTFEGYILASSARSYSYTTLQIIGCILVIINIIFLCILIATKHRIAK